MGLCDLPIPTIGIDCSVGSTVASSVGTSVLGDLAKGFVDGETEILKLLATSFLHVKTPDLASTGSPVAWLQGELQWLVVAAAVCGVIVAAGRMIWARKAQPASEAFSGLLKLIVVTGAGAAGVALLTGASDSFSSWILTESTKDPSGSLSSLATLTTGSFTSPALVLILAALGIIGSVVQLALLFVRGVLLVLLVGVWPLSCAASMISSSQWFRKVTAWIVAAVLYKFAAAIVFATAFRMMTSSTSGTGAIDGVILLALGSICLPVVLRLVVPAVAAAGGVGTAEVIAAGAGIAAGAAVIAGVGGAAAAAGASFGSAKSAAGVSKGGGPDGATNAGPSPSSSGGQKPAARTAATVQGAAKGVQQTASKLADGAEGETA